MERRNKALRPSGEMFPRVGFIVTNLTLPSRVVVQIYNKRGTAAQWNIHRQAVG